MRKLIVSLGFLLTLAACGKGSGDQTQVLHVGSQRGGTKALMLASGALDGAPYKVDWSEFAAAQPLLEAIGTGAVDVGVSGDAPFIFAYQSGSPIKAVSAQIVRETPYKAVAIVVPKNSPAQSLADLKGKKIATTRGSIGHYLVIRALAANKLPPDWVKLTYLAPGDTKAAFNSGAIDGWATWVPYLQPAYNDGARTIADGHDYIKAYGFDVAYAQSIQSKSAILADFLKREAKALLWAHDHVDAYADVLAKETGLPRDVAYDYALRNRRTAIPIDDTVLADQAEVLKNFKAAGAIKGDRPLADGFDRSLTQTKVAVAN